MEQQQSYELGYPFSWFNEGREIYLLTASAPDNGQSVILNTQGSDIVNPPYARIALRFELDGNSCQTPWIPMTVSPMILPTPNAVRRDFELLVEERLGITVTVQEFDRGDYDQIN